MNFELNKKNILILSVFILTVIIGLTLYDRRNADTPNLQGENITLVKDYSRFFTISNAGSKYINYLCNKDSENLVLLLSDTYVTVNNITKQNILTKIKLLDSKEYSFEANKMYQEKIGQNIIRYYVKGDLTEIAMDQYKKPSDYYLIIDLDLENLTFAVTPYDGNIFKEVK